MDADGAPAAEAAALRNGKASSGSPLEARLSFWDSNFCTARSSVCSEKKLSKILQTRARGNFYGKIFRIFRKFQLISEKIMSFVVFRADLSEFMKYYYISRNFIENIKPATMC